MPFSAQQTYTIALQHQQAGRTEQAEALYRQIIAQVPDHADALHMLGIIRSQAGDLQEGAALLERAATARPGHAIFHLNLGNALKGLRKTDAAIRAYGRAAALGPQLPEAHYNLANALKEAGRLDEAIAAYRRAIALKPSLVEAHFNLANSLRDSKRGEEAIAIYRQTLALRPDHAGAFNNLGNTLQDLGRHAEAVAAYRLGLQRIPNQIDILNNLGNALQKQGQLLEAIEVLQRALALKPDNAAALANLGNAWRANHRPDLAAQAYQRALELSPRSDETRWNLSMMQLLLGNLAEGWRSYESRIELTKELPRKFDQPRWDGTPLNGQRVLLHPEQGLGDSIHFVRYAPLVRARGGVPIIQCHGLLLRLFKSQPDFGQIVNMDDPPPRFDLHCPLMSLPLAFGTTLENIPAKVPYITPDPALAGRWRQRVSSMSTNRKIGLAWAGNPDNPSDYIRSTTLAALAPLSQLHGVDFFSLQKGPAAAQSLPAEMRLTDLTNELHDFADTAALISALDLVICVDTAVAHLAAAMGKPTWLLLPFAPDFRWLLYRPDSPWYPTMRLFRQAEPERWEEPIRQIAGELRAFVTQ